MSTASILSRKLLSIFMLLTIGVSSGLLCQSNEDMKWEFIGLWKSGNESFCDYTLSYPYFARSNRVDGFELKFTFRSATGIWKTFVVFSPSWPEVSNLFQKYAARLGGRQKGPIPVPKRQDLTQQILIIGPAKPSVAMQVLRATMIAAGVVFLGLVLGVAIYCGSFEHSHQIQRASSNFQPQEQYPTVVLAADSVFTKHSQPGYPVDHCSVNPPASTGGLHSPIARNADRTTVAQAPRRSLEEGQAGSGSMPAGVAGL